VAQFLLFPGVRSGPLLLFTALAGFFVSVLRADEVVKILAGNISSGSGQAYETPGTQILKGLKPDVALLQEMNVGTNSEPAYRNWVNTTFGDSFSYYVESGKSIPNGVVSRYPIRSSGFWEDSNIGDREFAWARIDIPGDKDLWAVSVHLKASDGSANVTRRKNQAAQLVGYINAKVPATDYLVVGGDFNTYSRSGSSEPCLTELSARVVIAGPWPKDQANNDNTNANQNNPYDWVMPSAALASCSTPLVIGSNTHTSGLVFDSRDYTPLSVVSPVASTDSGASGMQHMAVMRAFLIPTNDPPVIAQGTSVAVTFSKNNTPTAFSRSLSATDPEGNALTWSISTAAGHGTAGIVAPATGGSVALSYTPVTNYTGADSFVVQVSDGLGGTDTITVNLTIQQPPNTVPVITQGTSVAVTLSKNNTPTAFSRSLNATDTDGDALAWTILTAAGHGTAGIVAPATGSSVALSYTPVTNYTGTDSFTVQVSDGRGGTDAILVNLTIEEPPNVSPVIAGPAELPVTLSGNNTPLAFNLGLTATDADSDPLVWSVTATAAHGTAGISAPASGSSVSLTYQPAAGYIGSDSFTVMVSDGRGGTDTVTVNLMIENNVPVISQGESVAVTLSRNGFPDAFQHALSATDPNGHSLLWSISSPAAHGNAAVVAPGNGNTLELTYQPAAGFTGADSFTVQVEDGLGGADSIVMNVTVEAVSALDAWTYENFGGAALTPETEASLWGDDADPDGDGYPNILEFAHGLDPRVSDGAPNLMSFSFATEEGADYVILSHKIRMDGELPALNYTVQVTADPGAAWAALAAEDFTVLSETDLGGGFRQRTIRLDEATSPPARFFRLSLSR